MIKAISLTFDIDTDSGDVTNVKCQVEGQIKRKTTTKKKDEVIEPHSLIDRLDTKLVFNNKSLIELGIEAGDRVDIKYEKIKGILKPVIDVSGEKGNKLTKTQTVAFKGNQNTVLAEFGDQFTLEPFKDGMFRLIQVVGEQELGDSIKAEVIVKNDAPLQELDELTYEDISTNKDDLTDIDVLQFKF